MDRLARGLILLSDIERITPAKFQKVDLVALAAQCIEQLLAIHPKAHAILKTDLKTAPVAAEKDLLEMALMNLLENGVKYSAGNANIEVKIEKKGDALHCSVSDHGMGISPSDLPHIFDRFYAADKAQSRKAGGAGLGLSIVKNIVEKHGGKISASSQLGKGSLFTIVFPDSH
ncbi:MAG: ATP-binding protein [Verrucomicrobiota bacterium]|nr:ATP-binding protein [Verrucomicrobiota bacterium]